MGTLILSQSVMMSSKLSHPAQDLAHPTPTLPGMMISTTPPHHTMSVVFLTSRKISRLTELSPLLSLSTRTSLPTSLESTLTRLDLPLEVTPLRPLDGESRTVRTTGSV